MVHRQGSKSISSIKWQRNLVIFGTDLNLEANAYQTSIAITAETLELPLSYVSKELKQRKLRLLLLLWLQSFPVLTHSNVTL